MSKNFNAVCKEIVTLANNNVSLTETALHLFNCYIIDTYPSNIYVNGTSKLASAFIVIANEYLGQDTSSYDEELLNFAHKIKAKIESTPEIRL